MAPDRTYIPIAAFGIGRNYDRIVKVFDKSTKKEIATLDSKISGKLSISDDGKILAIAELWGEFTKVWNVETKELIADIKSKK
jgi:hypothetical protein